MKGHPMEQTVVWSRPSQPCAAGAGVRTTAEHPLEQPQPVLATR